MYEVKQELTSYTKSKSIREREIVYEVKQELTSYTKSIQSTTELIKCNPQLN